MIEPLIERIQHRLQTGSYPNEAAISFSVVMPILRALGWDDSDPEQVMPEYASGGRRVDFALSGIGKRPSIFIEVKGVGRALEGDRQLFEYAFHEGIPLCLLTDGRDWSFYLPSGQGTYDERRLYRLQLTERPPAESAQVLRRYLEQPRVKAVLHLTMPCATTVTLPQPGKRHVTYPKHGQNSSSNRKTCLSNFWQARRKPIAASGLRRRKSSAFCGL